MWGFEYCAELITVISSIQDFNHSEKSKKFPQLKEIFKQTNIFLMCLQKLCLNYFWLQNIIFHINDFVQNIIS